MSDPTSAIVPISPSTPKTPLRRPPKTPLRRPRSRLAGSNNKPKPPIIIAHESPGALRTHAIEIASGCDISGCIAAFARDTPVWVCILSSGGCVAKRHAGGIPRRPPRLSSSTDASRSCRWSAVFCRLALLRRVTVFLAGTQGQVVGECCGATSCSGAGGGDGASFAGASFERLLEGEVQRPVRGGGYCGWMRGGYVAKKELRV
ncbi:uncharacterized protein A4U43_C08F17930 [Asparagus officinalis]|nr:uncharacterized protein A4U43_C08F17930 [Asparagus officinalis]